MQLIKWIILFILLFISSLLAVPFIFAALFFNEYDTKQFLENTGKAVGRKCAIDLNHEHS